MEGKTQLVVYLDMSMREALRTAGYESRMTLSAIVREALSQWLSKRQSNRKEEECSTFWQTKS